MQSKSKLLLIVSLLLVGLSIATIVNISLNFREYGILNAHEKAATTAAIVKDGLTAHMVNGIMDKRQYFLDQISNNNDEIKSLWIVRSQKVIEQFGAGLSSETVRDAIDKKVLETGQTIQEISEDANAITLRVSIPYKATVSGNPNCLNCHNVQRGDILGAISMEFDISHMRSVGMMTIFKILAINLLCIIIVLLLANHYITPYLQLFNNMQEGIKKAYSGNFTYTFTTKVEGDAKNIVNQLNTLFRKIQETFNDIKHNLSTFIPQGCVVSSNPLQETQMIIKELSDIYKFKKTIELDLSKKIIYRRIIDVLKNKYGLKHFAFYEIHIATNTREQIYITSDSSICNKEVNTNATLCRAYRTSSDVISTEFLHLCQKCNCKGIEYVCIPFNINEEYALVISITTTNLLDVSRINSFIPSIKNYLEAAKPVIESRILTDKLRETSLRDPLTGLYNRRFLEEFIDKFMKQAKRLNGKYAVLMLDVDFFKSVNDTYGHDMGDTVIQKVATILQENIRESDLAIRYGGEEFVVLLHNADITGALKVAHKIHEAFGDFIFEVSAEETMQKTISIGISLFPQDGETIWKCIKYADNALYVAKTTGRDKIVVYTKEMSESEELR